MPQWQMSFNGDAVSLHPSIGNWNLRCRSHYLVREGRVIEAPQWTKEEIEAGRRRDKEARTKYLAGGPAANVSRPADKSVEPTWLERLIALLKSVF